MDGEVSVVWHVGEHRFVAVATLADDVLTLSLQMPVAFLVEASTQQRGAYGAARDRALDELASALAMQREGEHHHITH